MRVEPGHNAWLQHLELDRARLQRAQRVGVQGVDVVVVDEVLDHQLPVAVDLGRVLVGGAAILQAQEGEGAVPLGDEARERLGIGIEVDEDPPRPDAEPERSEAAAVGVEPLRLAHVGGADQPSGEVVAPAVIGAAEPGRVAGAGGHLDAAMGADVGEGGEGAGLVAGDDEGLAHQPVGQVVAGLGDLLDAGEADPVLEEDARLLPLEDLLGRIEVARQMARAVDRAARLELGEGGIGQDGLGDGHGARLLRSASLRV